MEKQTKAEAYKALKNTVFPVLTTTESKEAKELLEAIIDAGAEIDTRPQAYQKLFERFDTSKGTAKKLLQLMEYEETFDAYWGKGAFRRLRECDA